MAQFLKRDGDARGHRAAADRNREMMMSACQHNGGVVPGAQQESPVSLRNAPRR